MKSVTTPKQRCTGLTVKMPRIGFITRICLLSLVYTGSKSALIAAAVIVFEERALGVPVGKQGSIPQPIGSTPTGVVLKPTSFYAGVAQ